MDDPETPLKLPVRTGVVRRLSPLNVLGLDNLIHSDLLHGSGQRFLKDVLEVEEISPFVAVRDYLLRHYNDPPLDHKQRWELLHFGRAIWDELQDVRREERRRRLAEDREGPRGSFSSRIRADCRQSVSTACAGGLAAAVPRFGVRPTTLCGTGVPRAPSSSSFSLRPVCHRPGRTSCANSENRKCPSCGRRPIRSESRSCPRPGRY